MKSKKFEKSLMLKKVTIANLNMDEMKAIRGGEVSCPCDPDPEPTDGCVSVPSQGTSCIPTMED